MPKTPDEIKKGLDYCKPVWKGDHWKTCDEKCPYSAEACFCKTMLNQDAIALIKQLETKVTHWISVEERLPDGEVLAANFAPGTYGYKEYIIGYVDKAKCTESDWHRGKCYASNDHEILNNVTHWMPLPEPPPEN